MHTKTHMFYLAPSSMVTFISIWTWDGPEVVVLIHD